MDHRQAALPPAAAGQDVEVVDVYLQAKRSPHKPLSIHCVLKCLACHIKHSEAPQCVKQRTNTADAVGLRLPPLVRPSIRG